MGFDFNNKRRVNTEDRTIEYSPAKRHLAKWQWYLLVLVILSPLIYFLSALLIDSLVVTASGYISYDNIAVRAPENGYIKNILIKEGQQIKLGQCLIKIDSPVLNKELIHLKKELDQLKKIQSNTENPEIEHFIVMKKNLEKHLKTTTEYVKIMEDLKRKKLATITDQQKARTDFKNLELEIKDIDRAVARSNLYHKFKLEEQYGDIIRKLKTTIIKMEASMELLKIVSPDNGNIAKIFTNIWEYVSKGQDLMDIATHKNLRVLAYLDHKDMSSDIYQGKKVTVMLPDDIKIEGEIAQIPSLAEHQNKHINIIKTAKNKILLIVSMIGQLPAKYQIDGLPVKVVIEGYGLDRLID
jgi:multidrug resistance efflux pump